MKTLFRWIRYLAINGTFAVLVWLTLFVAPFNQNHHLASVLVFLTILLSVVSWVWLPIAFVVAIIPQDEKLKGKLPNKISVVPGWFDILFDLAITINFIYAGWIWVGIIYCSHIISSRISVACFQHAADKQNNQGTK